MRMLPPTIGPERAVALSIHFSCSPAGENGDKVDDTRSRDASSTNIERFVELATSSQLPFTWGVDESLYGELHQQFAVSVAQQELAILGDASWLGQAKSRGAMVRKLNSAVAVADLSDFTPKSLILQGVSLDADFDLLAKHGINIVACDETVGSNAGQHESLNQSPPTQASSVRTRRFGVWELPATVRLPQVASRLSLLGGGVNRQIDRALTKDEVTHIVIDGLAVAENPAELRNVERLLERLARQQEQGKLKVHTLSNLASQLGQSRDRTSATSILRSSPAAA